MKKVIVIGAGPAGLTAAYELLKNSKEYEVIVLEESDYIGGISRTVKYKGNRMDIGGHRFFSKDKNIMQWWKNVLPMQGFPSYDDKILEREKSLVEGGLDPEKEDKVMLLRQRVSRIYYNNKFFDYPISLKLQTFTNMGLIQTIKAGFSYLYSCVHKLPEDSLENFYINRFGKVLYSMFFEGYTEKLWGRHPREISADWGSQRVKGLSILEIVKNMFARLIPSGNSKVETSLIEEFIYPKYGPGQLWENVRDEIEKMGGKILPNTKVVKINTDENKVNSVETDTNEKFEADIFISSMPLKDLVNGMANVSDDIMKISNGLPYRDFVTVGVLLDKINLKNNTKIKTIKNRIPDCWIYVQDTSVKLGRMQIFNNWSPYLVKDVENTIWIGLEYFCTEGDEFWNMTEEECVSFVGKELVKIGVIDSAKDILDYHREKVKKAYPAYFDTYTQIDTLIDYLGTYKNLYCIGRNGQHRYNNMDHSMMTAMMAVNNIINGVEDKSNIWNVNVEKEYHTC